MLADTVKFACVFALLLVILWTLGFPPNLAYVTLPLLLLLVFAFAAGAGFFVSALMPLVPDLRFVIEQVLTVVMFLSGVAFALRNVPEHWQWVTTANPVMALLDAVRGVLMRGDWPQWHALWPAVAVSAATGAIGVGAVLRLAPRYPKTAI
jgi:lipopolysaccharide transport system permease protein